MSLVEANLKHFHELLNFWIILDEKSFLNIYISNSFIPKVPPTVANLSMKYALLSLIDFVTLLVGLSTVTKET